MPDGGWLVVAIVGVLLVAVFGYLIIKGHIDGKKVAETIAQHSGKLAKYLKKKRQHEKEAEKDLGKIPEREDFSPDAVDGLLDRTKQKWPPEE